MSLAATTSGVCDWETISTSLLAANTSTVVISIELKEQGNGDGNDLALDDIWFCQ